MVFGLFKFFWLALAVMFMACSGDLAESITILDMDAEQSSSSAVNVQDAPVQSIPFVGGPIMITEVDPLNLDYKDHEGDDDGWVELFNTSSDTVNLKGMALTNSLAEPQKFVFGDVSVPPASFMLVYMSGKNLPDYVAPHDSVNLVGTGCWAWTDAQADPPGESYANMFVGNKLCFSENGSRHFGATMRLGENQDLGWSSISAFVGTRGGSSGDVVDLSQTNEILVQAYITKGRAVSLRLVQTGLDDWKGYEMKLTGTGDSSTVYRVALPVGKDFPDLQNIYGTRLSPASTETDEVTFKAFSYIARNRGHEPHASFKAGKNGGSLYLMTATGEIADSAAYPAVPVGKSWSFGKVAAGGVEQGVFGFAAPSPYGFSEGYVVAERSPSLDSVNVVGELPPSGFYQQGFLFSFPADQFVRCTMDGAEPTENSPLVVDVNVTSTTVLRCASFVPGKMRGEILNRTYVMERAPSIPAVFITGDNGSFFDPDTGIYVLGPNAQSSEPHYGANYWLDKELPVFVELLETGVNMPAFAKNAGLKIFGNYSRQNKKKSVSITFREKYGDSHLKYPLFPAFPELKKFKVFILRNNGSNFNAEYIRDRLGSSVSEGLGVDYQRGRAVIVYYNGKYYGIHNIRERSTEHYFETHYGMNPDDIDLLKADNSSSAGSSMDYVALMNWLEDHTLENDEDYQYVTSQIDIDNYMNYMHTEIFINNRDWPANNLKKWRCNNPKTLWKWFIYDSDFGFGNSYSEFKNNIFEYVTEENGPSWPNGPEHTLLLRRLLTNPHFKTAFINRMSVLLSMNFESSRTLLRIEELMNEISLEIARDQSRWGHSKSGMSKELDKTKAFARNRPNDILSEMQEFFGLDAVYPVTLAVTGRGSIMVHNLKLDATPMTVNFFKGFPVLLTAVPDNGGIWAGWSDGVMDVSRVVVPGEISSVTAIFK